MDYVKKINQKMVLDSLEKTEEAELESEGNKKKRITKT